MTDMKRVVSIDPGLDDVAFATWFAPPRVAPWTTADFSTKIRCLDQATMPHVRTKPGQPLQLRLWTVFTDTRDLLGSIGPHLVIIEIPSIGGAYRGREGQPVTTGKLADAIQHAHMALGAIIAGAVDAGYPVQLWKPRKNKADRQAMVKRVLASEGRMLHKFTGDELDAIGVGMFADWNFDTTNDAPITRAHL